MDKTLILIIFGILTIFFGGKALQIVPIFLKLLKALFTGRVRWPGPRIHDPDPNASAVRQRLGVRYENLFSSFISNAMGVFAALLLSFLTFIGNTGSMSGFVRFNWSPMIILMMLVALAGGIIAFNKAQQNLVQLKTLLTEEVNGEEPTEIDGQSSRSEYAIEHPLVGVVKWPSKKKIALDQYYESVRRHQDGDEQKALILYQEALRADPKLHKNARHELRKMSHSRKPAEAGAIYYWIGIHSEYLFDWTQAVDAYEKAVNAFIQIGFKKRASRACNNLGNAKMKIGDPSAMDEFRKAVELDPQNGMAHISIGITYYRISERGDPRFEKALDAFANAIVSDSLAYTPLVQARLLSIGYTWQEDLEDVLQRADKILLNNKVDQENSRADPSPGSNQKRAVGFDPGLPTNKVRGSDSSTKGILGFDLQTPDQKKDKKTYKDEKYGFEIDIPKDWSIHKNIAPVLAQELYEIAHGWTPHVDVAFSSGSNEIMNIVVEVMKPEPTPNLTERMFRFYARQMKYTDCDYGRITVNNKTHTWARYQMKKNIWSKKYMIVINGHGYAVTASCIGRERLLQREKVWDEITTSFRLS